VKHAALLLTAAWILTGKDEHGDKIAQAAAQAGI
jgi:methionyl-tRNA synthetase